MEREKFKVDTMKELKTDKNVQKQLNKKDYEIK